MGKFIVLHISDNREVLVNTASITTILPVNDYRVEVGTFIYFAGVENDYIKVLETYEQVKELVLG